MRTVRFMGCTARWSGADAVLPARDEAGRDLEATANLARILVHQYRHVAGDCAQLVAGWFAANVPVSFGRLLVENENDRGLKFIRAAFIWFIVATAMLVFVPVYNFGIYMPVTGSRIPFSHAFFGAYRHAITVGFIMMMIVGVSSKIVPALSGVDLRRATSLWPTFILLNLGNAMRVTFQIATDYTPSAFPIMGVSGFIEVVGLTLWAYELASNMLAGSKIRKQTDRLMALRYE
jgi:uncharacterized protein involved in response to NO